MVINGSTTYGAMIQYIIHGHSSIALVMFLCRAKGMHPRW